MASFPYPPLDPSRRQIRLLRPLCQQRPDQNPTDANASPLSGVAIVPDLSNEFELQVVSVDDKPVYTALSYVWGDNKNLKPITVNGSSFLVTSNLKDALEHLRFEDIAPAIWIDSICIDQTSSVEKNKQLQLMGSIYSRALRVIVWLGLRTETSDVIADILHEYGKNVRRRFNVPSPQKFDLVEYIEFDSESEICGLVDAAIKSTGSQDLIFTTPKDFMRAFVLFTCSREWWYRVWVLQEFILAERVHFQVGLRKIELEELVALLLPSMLFNLYSVVEHPFGQGPELFTRHVGIDWVLFMIVYRDRQHQKRDVRNDSRVFELLCTTYCRPACHGGDEYLLKATNKEDQIYGLFGLFQDDYETLGLIVDYCRTWQDVYSAVAQKLIQAGYLDIFALCQAEGTSDSVDMPSWAPIWHQAIHPPNGWFKTSPGNSRTLLGNSLFSAASSRQVQATFSTVSNSEGHPTRSMRISGVFVDEVMEVKSTYLRSSAVTTFQRKLLFGQLFREIQYLCKQSQKLGFYTYTTASLQDAVWRMPVWDHELAVDSPDFRRITKISLNRYQACLPFFKGIEAQMRAEQISSRSPKYSWFSSQLKFLSACFYRVTSRFFFFVFSQTQQTGTGSHRLFSWLKLVPALFRAEPLPILQSGQGITLDVNCYLLTMEGGRPIRPFITKTGYIGLGPGSVQPNDIVCMCFGARVPHVLRPLQDGRSGYSFVGEAFVYGLMDGEGMNKGFEERHFDVF